MIPIVRPELGEAERAAALRAIESGWISHGPRCVEFEAAVAARLGLAHGRAVNSCTNGILLTLLALDVRPGDEVIVPAFTCVAALNPIALLGATPVPVDVEPSAFGLEAGAVAAAITDRTRGIIFAHLFGFAADLASVASLARERGLWLIEDIALGFGALDDGRPVGTVGDAAVLSFHPRKLITTGEGGMVATDRDDLAERVAALRNYGASRPAWERHNARLSDLPVYAAPGLNCKLTDIQAAIGVEQVRRLDALIAARGAIAERYTAALGGLGWAELLLPRPRTTPSWQSFVLVVRGEDPTLRGRLLEHLETNGIAAVQGAQAMHAIDFCERRYAWPAARFPHADAADRDTLCLPIFPSLPPEDQERVIAAVLAFRP